MFEGLTDSPSVESLYLSMLLNHFQTHLHRHCKHTQSPFMDSDTAPSGTCLCFKLTNIDTSKQTQAQCAHVHTGHLESLVRKSHVQTWHAQTAQMANIRKHSTESFGKRLGSVWIYTEKVYIEWEQKFQLNDKRNSLKWMELIISVLQSVSLVSVSFYKIAGLK